MKIKLKGSIILIVCSLFIFNVIRAEALIESGIEGTFSIGPEPSDYLTLSSAIDDLKANGVCGQVILNIKSGTYSDKPLIGEIPGVSATNNILIQSQALESSLVVFESINTNAENYVIQLENTSYINLKYLTLRTLSTGSNMVVLSMKGVVSNCEFSHLDISTGSTISSGVKGLVRAVNTNVNDIYINNCTFKKGTEQIVVECFSGLGPCSNFVIENNQFLDDCRSGINIKSVSGIVVRDNYFVDWKSQGAILINGGSGALIERNSMILEGSSTVGVSLSSISSTESNPTIVRNNFIKSTDDAITVNNCKYTNIVHNNFWITDDGFLFTLVGSNIESIKYLNNVAHSGAEGILFYSFLGIDFNQLESDYNCYHNESDITFRVDNVNYTFLEWRAGFDQGTNSFTANPNFVSDIDLHVDNNILLDGQAKLLNYVNDDFDRDIRNSLAPDIGADEFSLDLGDITDLTLSRIEKPNLSDCTLADSIVVIVVNKSAESVDSFDIDYSILQIDQQRKNIYQTILPGDSARVVLSSFEFATNTLYDLEVEVLNPNGTLDDNSSDNSSMVSYQNLQDATIYIKEEECESGIELYVKKRKGVEYMWSTGETKHKIENVIPGFYTVSITNSQQCIVTNSINVD